MQKNKKISDSRAEKIKVQFREKYPAFGGLFYKCENYASLKKEAKKQGRLLIEGNLNIAKTAKIIKTSYPFEFKSLKSNFVMQCERFARRKKALEYLLQKISEI